MTDTTKPEDAEKPAIAVPHPKFGDLLRNTAASERNPHRDAIFIRKVRTTGRMNRGLWYEMTDGKGKVWNMDPHYLVYITPTPPTASQEASEQEEKRKAFEAWYKENGINRGPDAFVMYEDPDSPEVYHYLDPAVGMARHVWQAATPTGYCRSKAEPDFHGAAQKAYAAFREGVFEELRGPEWDELNISQHLQWMAAAEASHDALSSPSVHRQASAARTRDELLDYAQTFGAVLGDFSGTVSFDPSELERFVAALTAAPQSRQASAGQEGVTDEQIDAIWSRPIPFGMDGTEWRRRLSRDIIALAKARPTPGEGNG